MLVRVKDRLNTPVEKSGHRDVLINFEHELTAVRKTSKLYQPRSFSLAEFRAGARASSASSN